MLYKGHNGQVEFDGTTVKIMRKGALAMLTQGLKGDKTIPVGQIIAVQFKDANMLTNGFIQFSTAAGESGGGIFSATEDENTVMFNNGQKAEFAELRDAVQKAVLEKNSGGAQSAPESPLDALKKLKDLLDAGVITQDEFDAKKERLMGEI